MLIRFTENTISQNRISALGMLVPRAAAMLFVPAQHDAGSNRFLCLSRELEAHIPGAHAE
jgi:hypothetical protein